METSSIARRLSRRFVAGETLAEALAVGKRINSEGITLTLDHLGELVTVPEEAEASRDAYIRVISEIKAAGIQGNVSLKLTQFGMDLSEASCRANVGQVVRRAAEIQNFVRVDMESSEYTDRTLRLVTIFTPIRRGGYGDPGVSVPQPGGHRMLCARGSGSGYARAHTWSRPPWPSHIRPTSTATIVD